uniref:Uncharacterized protein n=1 Tax=Anguilla anguilla TaxID=7936 RepID=A0A0E9X355_ANGAN
MHQVVILSVHVATFLAIILCCFFVYEPFTLYSFHLFLVLRQCYKSKC